MDSGEVTDFTLNPIIQSQQQLKSWSCTVCMLTPLNHPKCLHDSIFFTVDDNWIEFPQSGCPFPVRVWRVATVCRGIQTHSLIHLTHISHLTWSKWLHIFQKKKKKNGGIVRESNLLFSDVKLEVFFALNTILLLCENIFPLSLRCTVTARRGPGPTQACQRHSVPQQLLVAVTSWPAFLPRCE